MNHVVQASAGQAGVRWYELRTSPYRATISNLGLFQSGTFAPDSNYRWMGSMAQDKNGDIALGYSESSSSSDPSIYVTGRVLGDPIGQMEEEVQLPPLTGTGPQGITPPRWGDYSSMAIDPSDGCTFWYVQEYYLSGNGSNWHTRLNSFRFNGCQ